MIAALAGRTALCLLLIGLFVVAPSTAQHSAPQPPSMADGVLRGNVIKGGQPVPGIQVTLHRVLRENSGPIGQEVTDASGRFEFRLPDPDSANPAVLFTTAEHQSVRYFGRAVHPNGSDGEYTLEVYDTAAVVPQPIRLSRRDMMLFAQPDGGWQVEEIVRIHNPNSVTLISSGGSPAWHLAIPEGVDAFEVGESEVPANAVQRMGARVLLTLPLTPGQRELYLRYRIPGSTAEAVLPLDSPADTFNLFVRQPSPRLEITGLTSTEMITVEQEQYLRYAATDLPEGTSVGIRWESVAPPVDPIVAAVVVTLLLLAAGAVAAARRPRGSGGPPLQEEHPVSRELAGVRAE